MRIENILWLSCNKMKLPELFFGLRELDNINSSFSNNPYSEEISIAHYLDFSNNQPQPFAMVMQKKIAIDVFSWLSVYAPEAMPASQFFRVISNSDWEKFKPRETQNISFSTAGRWACVILAEMIAQSTENIEISAIPLSTVSSCFTTTMSRASMLFQNDEATQIVLERLRILEKDQRFARRQFNMDSLLPVWAFTKIDWEMEFHLIDTLEVMLEAIRLNIEENSINYKNTPRLNAYSSLDSDSIEERVIAFQKLQLDLDKITDPSYEIYKNAFIASAAFLVGRGTSHLFLLKKCIQQFPLAILWFGAIAGIVGVRFWDSGWAKIVKAVEKRIRSSLVWQDSSEADICWLEIEWMLSIYKGPEVFQEIPKLFSKVLSIELIPGVICQLRLESLSESLSSKSQTKAPVNEKEILDTFRKMKTLFSTLESLIGKVDQNQSQQLSFFEEQYDVNNNQIRNKKRSSRPKKKEEQKS